MALPPSQGLPDPVHPTLPTQLVDALDEAIARMEGVTAADPIPVLRLLRSARDAVPAAEARLTREPAPAGLRAWRHELRTYVAAMAGWATLFSQTLNPETHARARTAIERNARAMARLLARPLA